MPSIHPDYEYDIFISYRHNDNIDGWVTRFVEALQNELKATLKNEVSIYFDKNPHDGLLETHQVDASLAKKLKCLVFIPIISQTYCDESSFAWEHELLPFVKMAKKDDLGMNITLSNGNVMSRVLPVQIHSLDEEDESVLKNVLGGPVRSIKFIHQASGINRHLTQDDDKVREAGKILYSDQINKVANALKKIGVSILKQPHSKITESIIKPKQKQAPTSIKRSIYITIASVIITSLLYFGYKQYEKSLSPLQEDISIAVLAFADMSPNQDQEYFSDGISEELLNLLSKTPELRVTSRTSSFSYKGKDYTAQEIGKELKVTYLLEGSVRKSASAFRITAQLIKTIDGSHIWSETYDSDLVDVFKIQDEIGAEVTKKLHLTLLGKQFKNKTVDTDAYNLYLKANHLTKQFNKQAYLSAEILTNQSINIDSTYSPSWALLGHINNTAAYTFLSKPKAEASKLALEAYEKAIELDSKSATAYASLSLLQENLWDFENAKKSIQTALELEPHNSKVIGTAALLSSLTVEESITLLEKAIKLNPNNYFNYFNLATSNLFVNNLDEAEEALKTFALYYPNSSIYHYVNSRILIERGNLEEALIEAEKESDDFFHLYGKIFATFALGKEHEADSLFRLLIDSYGKTEPTNIAEVFAFKGDIENSFIWLNKGLNIKDPVLLEGLDYPSFKTLYNDPRWNEVIDKVGFNRDHSLERLNL